MFFHYLLSVILSKEDNYIVMLKDGRQNYAEDHLTKIQNYIEANNQVNMQFYSGDEASKSEIQHVFNPNIIQGYSGNFNQQVKEYIEKQPEVLLVEKDEIMEAVYQRDYYNQGYHSHQTRWSKKPKGKWRQKGAPWGLTRITTLDYSPLNSDFIYDANAGKGVNVYILDTGINIEHQDFGGRASWGVTIPEDEENEDGNGHGTHVAGIVAGKIHGVARKAQLFAVKVLDNSGYCTTSNLILGIQWVLEHARKNYDNRKGFVMNISIGGPKSEALNKVIDIAFKQGVVPVVAAGNENRNACETSPSSSAYAITVGATTKEDEKANFSNYGECVDIWAPGHKIKSAWISSTSETNTDSGTSMASPHVAGVVAVLVSKFGNHPGTLKYQLLSLATRNKIKGLDHLKSPNKLVYLSY